MAEVSETTWTCNRCGAKGTLDYGKQPERWHRIKDAAPPRHAEPETVGDVCEDCWVDFCSWWNAARNGGPSDG